MGRDNKDFAYNNDPSINRSSKRFSFSSSSNAAVSDSLEEERDLPLHKEPVFLNVYDLMLLNYTTSKFGLGIYHTGVEVYGAEYCYSGHVMAERTGLRCTAPQDSSWIEEAIFREKISVGFTEKTREQVVGIYTKMHDEYLGPSYNVMDRNCNHFTEEFLSLLLDEESKEKLGPEVLPSQVTRLVRAASTFRTCMPNMFTADLREQKREELEEGIRRAEIHRKKLLEAAERKLRAVREAKLAVAQAEAQERATGKVNNTADAADDEGWDEDLVLGDSDDDTPNITDMHNDSSQSRQDDAKDVRDTSGSRTLTIPERRSSTASEDGTVAITTINLLPPSPAPGKVIVQRLLQTTTTAPLGAVDVPQEEEEAGEQKREQGGSKRGETVARETGQLHHANYHHHPHHHHYPQQQVEEALAAKDFENDSSEAVDGVGHNGSSKPTVVAAVTVTAADS
eukprot:g59008.t1